MGGHAGNIEAVFVEGRVVKWAGELTARNVENALSDLERSCEYLYGRDRKFEG